MFHAISAVLGRLLERILARLDEDDEFAAHNGWQVTKTRFGGRSYRDLRFSQLATARTASAPGDPTWAQAAIAGRIRDLGPASQDPAAGRGA